MTNSKLVKVVRMRLSRMVDFDFKGLFDENTVKVKEDFVDVEFILRKREENERHAAEREEEKKQREEERKRREEEGKDAKAELNEEGKREARERLADDDQVPNKKSKRKEGKRGQNKKRGQHFEEKMDDKVD